MLLCKRKKVLPILLCLAMISTVFAAVPFTANAESQMAAAAGVSYAVYGQNYAWQAVRANGAEAGTDGQSKRVEALKISLAGNLPAGASIIYQVHGQSYGWTQPVKSDGAEAGTEHQSKRIEALRITLKDMPGYKVEYRVHQQTYGWSGWVVSSDDTNILKAAIAGVTGKSKRIEAVEIKLIKPANTANVSTSAELNAALENSNIDTISLTSNITASPVITRPLTINFGAYTLTGDVTFSYAGKGTSVLTGDPDNRIIGNLTVNTANASFKNGVKVSGKVNIANVEIGTWTELATGNTLYITDPDGATLDVTGHPVGVQVAASASGNLTIDVGDGGAVDGFSSSAPVAVVVAAGGTVTSLTAGTGATGSSITNNGIIGTLTAVVPINLIANVAPGSTLTSGSGSVTVTGASAGSVSITSGSAPIPSTNNLSVQIYRGAVNGFLEADAYPTEAHANYQWQICDTMQGAYANIPGATSSIYAWAPGDAGKYIRVMVTGTQLYSGETASSDAFAVPYAQIAGKVSLTIPTPSIGETPATTIATGLDYTGTIQWTSPASGNFEAGTTPSATIVLTADTGYSFALMLCLEHPVTVAGSASLTYTAGGAYDNTLTITVAYPKLVAPTSTVTMTVNSGDTPPSPVEGAAITLYDGSDQVVNPVDGSGNAVDLVTDAQGTCTFNLPSGEYYYEIGASGYKSSQNTFVVSSGSNQVTVTLAKYHSVTFTVTQDGSTPTTGAIITIYNDNTIYGGAQTTDSNGQCIIYDLPSGNYMYSIRADGYSFLPLVRLSVTSDNPVNVNLANYYSVTLSVTDGSTPISGATVTVYDSNHIPVVFESADTIDGQAGSNPSIDMETDGSGKLQFYLPNGTYTYTVSKDGYADSAGNSFTVNNGDVTPTAAILNAKTVLVGAQSNAITAASPGQSATFAVTTANIAEGAAVTIGWFEADGTTPASAPAGLTADGAAVSGNASTITVNAENTTAGTYYFKATIDGVTSTLVSVTVS